MKKKQMFIVLTITLITIFSINTIKAGDEKIQGGAICKAQDGDQADDLHHNSGYVTNIASSNRGLICPIMRDKVESEMNSIVVNGTNSSGTTTCKFRQRSYDGLGGYGQTISATGSNWELEFDDSHWSTRSYYYYYFYCSLAPNSKIYRFRWIEG